MFLPVVIRELSVRARLYSTYYVRVVAAGLIALVVVLGLMVQALGGSLVGAASIGAGLLQAMVSLLLLYVLVEGVRQASGGISQERREGTLGFLFLTDLSSLDVLLGKLSGAAVNALYTLLATLPFAGLALLFGGVTGGEFFRDSLALLAALAVALGCGAWASVRCRDAMAAVGVATALVLGILILPLILDALWQSHGGSGSFELRDVTVGRFSPIAAVALAGDLMQRSGAGAAGYWWSLAAQLALTALLVADAARRLQGMWRRDENAARAPRKMRRSGSGGSDPGRLIAQTLAARIHLGRWLVALLVLTFLSHLNTLYQLVVQSAGTGIGISATLTSLPAGLASLVRKLLFVQLATRTFADARHSGEMEILLTTRLDNAELVRLLWLALRRVVLCLVGLDLLFGLADGWLAVAQLPATVPLSLRWSVGLTPVLLSLAGVLAWVALTWSAMWFGIASRSTTAAVVKAFGLDIAILAIAYMVGGIGMMLLQLLVQFTRFGTGGIPAFLHFMPILSLLVGLNWLRWRWARNNLALWFRPAAAGLLP